MKLISLNGYVVWKNFGIALAVSLVTFFNDGFAWAGLPPPTLTGTDVIENFSTPMTFTDGLQFGAFNALTIETSGSPTLSIVDNSYLLATSPEKSDGFIIRSTDPLPTTYKVTVDIGDINFELVNPDDHENGFYLPTITAVAGSPTTNDWWHENRIVHMDIDNNNVGSTGGDHPVFFGYYDPTSVGAPDPADGQWVFDKSTSTWVKITDNWAAAFNYENDTWYTFEIEKTETDYFYRIYDAATHTLLVETSIPIANVRNGDDYLAIGDPHTNYYNGDVKISNLRITNIASVPEWPSIVYVGFGMLSVFGLRFRSRISGTI